jgi:hypothetical protein
VEGIDREGDPAARYALLAEARDLALAVGNTGLVRTALEETAKHFEVDWWELLAATVDDVAESRIATTKKPEIARAAMEWAEEALAADQFDGAMRLAGSAHAMAVGRDGATAGRALELTRKLPEIEALYERSQQAAETLAKDPDDPEANLTLGVYHALAKDSPASRTSGLRMLAKSGNAALKAAADAERTAGEPPLAPGKMADLGDAWYAAAESVDDELKPLVYRRAEHWYQQAEPKLEGFTARKVTHRLETIREKFRESKGARP